MADHSKVAARLADLPQAGGWDGPLRAEAAARLEALGMPTRRDEYWLFTRPDALVDAAVTPAQGAGDEASPFADIDALTLVFRDGRFDAAASDPLTMEGVEITPMAEAGAWAQDLAGTLEAACHNPVPRPLAALAVAAARDGLAIRVTGQAARPIHIRHIRENPAADVYWHHVIRVEPDACATVLESGAAGGRWTSVVEADLADRATLHHLAAFANEGDRLTASHLLARLGAEARLKGFALSMDGRLMRNESVVTFTGDDAQAHVAAAVLGQDGMTHDDTVFITHDAVNCESRQVYKKVLNRGATGVFQGKILVQPGAQKTDGYQMSQALLLDDGAQFLAKPELEIYADDVACSHGSTTGAIDPTALFYLRARGIPKDRAVVLMVLSFLADALDEVEDEALRDAILARIEARLTA